MRLRTRRRIRPISRLRISRSPILTSSSTECCMFGMRIMRILRVISVVESTARWHGSVLDPPSSEWYTMHLIKGSRHLGISIVSLGCCGNPHKSLDPGPGKPSGSSLITAWITDSRGGVPQSTETKGARVLHRSRTLRTPIFMFESWILNTQTPSKCGWCRSISVR